MGRLFKSPQDFEKQIEKYFEYCDNYKYKKIEKDGSEVWVHSPKPYTITGLAVFLKTNKMTLLAYKNREGFDEVYELAKLRCENYAEENLFKAKNPVGTIFSLKNNFDWKDKQESDVNLNSTISVVPPKFD